VDPPPILPRGERFRWLGQTEDGESRSSSWTDVYLTNRALGRTFKTSFHASGKFQTSFLNEEIAAEWDTSRSRHLDQWQAPPEFAPGWMHLFEVILPGSEMRPVVEAGVAGKPVTVLPCPWDRAVHVYVMKVDLGSNTALRVESTAHIATLEIDPESRAVVIATVQEWTAGAAIVQRERTSPTSRQLGTGAGVTEPSDATRWLLHGTHVEGGKFIIDAAGITADVRPSRDG